MPAVISRRNLRASLALVSLLTCLGQLHAQNNEPIGVVVDQAKLVKIPDNVSTIVVGNPLIADVTLQPGGMVVVTGKGYGSTNMIAMDRAGGVIEERSIQVEGPTHKLVTVFRGTERETYSCTPACQRRVTLGDGPTFFDATITQGGNLAQRAAAAGSGAAGAATAAAARR